RRHTRSYGDWSSDVCSSDLAPRVDYATRGLEYSGSQSVSKSGAAGVRRGYPQITQISQKKPATKSTIGSKRISMLEADGFEQIRSEERRVGKECRELWSVYK